MEAILHREADKYLNRLNVADRDRIYAALDDLEKEPPEGDITPIAGEPGRFRTRGTNDDSYRFKKRNSQHY
jgi:mRNA-degrading endonuclease RelE of RelBE toxin-antitoxin system